MPVPPYDHEHENEVTPFGITNFRGQKVKFGIKTDDRRRHMYILGKTGMGKTTVLENLVISDILAGHGVAYVDPHGDTAEKMLDFIPPHRLNDVVYFSPSDMAYPIGFNILEVTNESQKHLVASGLMGVFKKIWPDVWSPRMEYILLNCVLALLDTPGTTLMGISRILSDKDFRRKIVDNVKDPFVKSFWVAEFAKYTDKFASEAIAPVQNKVGQFLSSVIIRNIVAQSQSTIDIRKIMDERKILLVNLSKGAIGEDSMKLLGGMLITRLQLAAMERVDMPEKDRQDFYLYVDEFQNFATESFANILSEARKYRLNLITAHQYIEQLEEEVAAAIFGNVGTIASFRVGAGDAEHLAKEFAPTFIEEDMINLAKYEIYLKLMIDGVASSPFSALTLPPIANRTGSRDKVIESSRERYAIKREVIEEKVNQSFADQTPGAPKPFGGAPAAPGAATPSGAPFASGEGERQYAVTCGRCGKALKLKFPPDPGRPFFCKECLPLAKAEGLTKPPPALASPSAPRPATSAFAPRQASLPSRQPAPTPRPSTPAASRPVTPAPVPAPKPVVAAPRAPAPVATPKPSAPEPDAMREASFAATEVIIEVPKQPKPAPLPKLSTPQYRPAPSATPNRPAPPRPAPPAAPPPKLKPAPVASANHQSRPNQARPLPPPPKEGMFVGKIRLVQDDNFDEDLKMPVKAEKKTENTENKEERPLVMLTEPKLLKTEPPPIEPPKSRPPVPPQNGPTALNPGQKVTF